jgi:hypothetical protein
MEEIIINVYPPQVIPLDQSKEIGFITIQFKHNLKGKTELDVVENYPVMSINHPGPDFVRDNSRTRHRHNQEVFLIKKYDAELPLSTERDGCNGIWKGGPDGTVGNTMGHRL